MRAHAHVEDHIRRLKDSGLCRFPFTSLDANRAWLATVCFAGDLVRWFQLLCLTGPLARAEPKIPTSIEHERWQRVALALMLAERSDRVSPGHPWCHVQMQILSTGVLSAEFGQFRVGPRFETAEDVARLEKWLNLVENAQLSPIAVERTVSMARRIVDHVDTFIDAVIVWESLFGAGDTQELSHRMSMTMACVLSADPRERVTLQQDIKSLYTKRSQIVHGGKRLNSSQASELRQRAQRLTLDALRAVLEDHPHLLGQTAADHVAFVLGVLPETETKPSM